MFDPEKIVKDLPRDQLEDYAWNTALKLHNVNNNLALPLIDLYQEYHPFTHHDDVSYDDIVKWIHESIRGRPKQ